MRLRAALDMHHKPLLLLTLCASLSACDPMAGFHLACILCTYPSLSVEDFAYLLKGDTVRVRAHWYEMDPSGSWRISDPDVAAFQVDGTLQAQVDGPVDHVLVRTLRSNAGFSLFLTPRAQPDRPAYVALSVVDSSQVERITFRGVPASDTVYLKRGDDLWVEPWLETAFGARVIGWPEVLTVSDTLVTAVIPSPPTAYPRLLHLRAGQAGRSRLIAQFGRVVDTLTLVVAP